MPMDSLSSLLLFTCLLFLEVSLHDLVIFVVLMLFVTQILLGGTIVAALDLIKALGVDNKQIKVVRIKNFKNSSCSK